MNDWCGHLGGVLWNHDSDWKATRRFQRNVVGNEGLRFESNEPLPSTIDTSSVSADGSLIRSDRLARLEAVLLIAEAAVSAKKLAQYAGLVDAEEARQLVQLLNTSYDRVQSAFRIEKTATGYLLMTRPALVTWLDRLHERQAQMQLSAPAMETLTIIAYQQPITRVGVESIRGAQCTDMIRQLIDRGLVKVGGEEDSLGRPFLYVTTREFLDMFGLDRIEDLPDYQSIGRREPNDEDQVSAEIVPIDQGKIETSESVAMHAIKQNDVDDTEVK